MILVFTHKITPRFSYIFRHIFKEILGLEIGFTTKVDEFVAHSGPKITYTHQPLGKEFFIRSHSLLFQQGIGDPEIHVKDWDGVPAFFPVGENSGLPFDIFAASFYLISRYEEYQPFVPDAYSRFPAGQSILFETDALKLPVVDIWAMRLKEKLRQKYPDYEFPEREFAVSGLVELTETFAYKYKGILRTLGGFVRDLTSLKFKKLIHRSAVLIRLRPDPYRIYRELIDFLKLHGTRAMFFILWSEFNTFDTNISPRNRKHRLLIKRIIDYMPFGQLFSYYTVKDAGKIEMEKNRLEELIIRPVTNSRQHRNRMEIPVTYRNLIESGIENEYSMGYENHLGFRAGTCTPFYFYDLDYEIRTPLKIHPVALTDRCMIDHLQWTPEEANLYISELIHQVKKVNGTFVFSVRNPYLSDVYPGWKDLFYKLFTLQ